jgi:hypothetical protein
MLAIRITGTKLKTARQLVGWSRDTAAIRSSVNWLTGVYGRAVADRQVGANGPHADALPRPEVARPAHIHLAAADPAPAGQRGRGAARRAHRRPMAAKNKCLAQSNKSPHRANATKKRTRRPSTGAVRQPRTSIMTRLLLCTAALLIPLLTAFATPANAVPRFCYSLRTGQFTHWGPCRVVCNRYGPGGYCRKVAW